MLGKALINKLASALIVGSVSVVNTLGPQRVIFGGGIIEGMPYLIDRIKEGVKKYALPKATASLDIIPAKLHNDSGVGGAAAYALLKLKKK